MASEPRRKGGEPVTRSPGPLCICGCYRAEHLACVSHDWRWEYAECQTCDCERFTASRDESDARAEGVAPAAGGDQ